MPQTIAYRQAYYRENKKKICDYQMAYKHLTKAERTNNRRKVRLTILARFGSHCARCEFTDIRALQIDHIHGGGTKERKRRGTDSFYRYLLKLQEAELHKIYQCLCANCNWIKKYENNEIRY